MTTNLSVNNFSTDNFETVNFNAESLSCASLSANALYENGKPVATNESVDQKIAQIPSYTLPKASSNTLGGVKVNGNNLAILNDGTLSAAAGGGGGDVPHTVKGYEVLTSFDMATVDWTQTTGTIAILAMPWQQGDIYLSAEPGYDFIYNNERTSGGVCHIGTTYGWYLLHKVYDFNCYVVQQVATGGW